MHKFLIQSLILILRNVILLHEYCLISFAQSTEHDHVFKVPSDIFVPQRRHLPVYTHITLDVAGSRRTAPIPEIPLPDQSDPGSIHV